MKKIIFLILAVSLIGFYVNAGNQSTTAWGRSVVIEDSTFNNPGQYNYVGYDSVVYRNCIFQNSYISTGGNVIGLQNIGVARFDECTFSNIRSTSTSDYHAINVWTNVDSLIVTNSTFYNISADGIQVGHTFYYDTTNNYLNYMLVDNCVFENPPDTSTENGIDIKAGFSIKGEIKNCTFSGFHFCNTGGYGCTGCNGEAVAVHYRFSENIYIHDNEILDGTIGVYVGEGSAGGNPVYEAPPKNIHVYNNVIDDLYDAVNLQIVKGVYVYNNFISNSRHTGIYLKYIEDMEVNNNTVAKTATSGHAIQEYNASTGSTEYTNNLIAGSNGSVSMYTTGYDNMVIPDASSIHFVDYDNNDFHLTSSSSLVINEGTNNGLTFDFDNESRPYGSLYDVGADEYQGAVDTTEVDTTGVTSTQSWQTFEMSSQTDTFTVTYDAVPNANNITGVTTILLGEATGYSSSACLVSFGSTGTIVARDGGAYDADSTVNYSSGTSYHFRLEIDIPNHIYSIYVTPEGGGEILLGEDYAFRTEQSSVSELDGWALYAGSAVGTHTVSNMSFNEGITSTRSWQTFEMNSYTDSLTVTYNAVPNANNITGLTTILLGEATAYSSSACLVSFDSGGTILVRDGSAYDAETTVSYSAGTSYYFRLEISIPNHTYSVYVTPDGGSETLLADDYAFRTEQSSVSELDGWAIYAGSDVGTHTVTDMEFKGSVTSTTSWQTFSMGSYTDTLTVTYDAIPNADSIIGVTTVLLGEATAYSSSACLVSFNSDGTIVARDGGAYDADATVTYTADTSYHFRLEISIPDHIYSIYVTPGSGSEVLLGDGYAFRTEQSSVSELDGWALYAGSGVGTHTVYNMTFTDGEVIQMYSRMDPTAISEKHLDVKDLISIYPNPSSTGFNVVLSAETKINEAWMALYDLNGREIKNIPITNHQTFVERSGLKRGMFFYRVFNDRAIIGNGKLVVQ